MKAILNFFIKQRYFTEALTIAVIMGGIASALTINYEVFPNVILKNVMVNTIYPGASAEEVEKAVTNLIEPELEGLEGVEKITSQSTPGQSLITLNIMETYELNKAEEDIRNAIDQIMDLPEKVERPIVTSPSINEVPLVELGISGLDSMLELRQVVHSFKRELQFLSGVSSVNSQGMQDREISVELDIDRMKHNWLSLKEVIEVIRINSLSLPAGDFSWRSGQKSGEVIIDSQFQNLQEIRNITIRANELGNPIKLGDVAKVKYELEEVSSYYIINGNQGIGLGVAKQADASVFEVIKEIEGKVKGLKEKYPDLKIDYVNNNARFVEMRLSSLFKNFLLGLVFIFLLLPFIIEFRYVVIIATGQVLAFMGAMILLKLTGTSINMISLVGLIIMVGIVFDDAIVVNENIDIFMKRGYDLKAAALEGSYSIIKPITAAILTTMVAFLPLAFMPHLFGRFVREVPIAVLSVLAVSYLETFIMLPAHAAYWFSGWNNKESRSRLSVAMSSIRQKWPVKVIDLYVSSLKTVLKHSILSFLGFLFLLLTAVFIMLQFMQINLFPSKAVIHFYVETIAHDTTSLDAHHSAIMDIVKQIREKKLKSIENITATVGVVQRQSLDLMPERGTEFGQIQVFMPIWEERKISAADLMQELKVKIKIPETIKRANWILGEAGPPAGSPIDISIMGEDYEKIMEVVKNLKSYLHSQDGVRSIEDSFYTSSKYFSFDLLPNLSQAAGVGHDDLGRTLQAAFWGVEAGEIRELNELVKIQVRFQGVKDQFNNWQKLEVMNQGGDFIKLDQIATVKRVQRPIKHEHLQGKRRVKVTGQIDENKISSREVGLLTTAFLEQELGERTDITYQLGGESEETTASLAALWMAGIVALICILLILILTFNGMLKPLLILLILPSSIVAVILAFFVHGEPISFLALLGVVALLGVGANDSIVFLHHYENSTEGSDILNRVLETAQARGRPIFMTTITTVLGVLPTAYGFAGEDPFIKPLALAIGWGVLLGSLISFYIFPLGLYSIDRLRIENKKNK